MSITECERYGAKVGYFAILAIMGRSSQQGRNRPFHGTPVYQMTGNVIRYRSMRAESLWRLSPIYAPVPTVRSWPN